MPRRPGRRPGCKPNGEEIYRLRARVHGLTAAELAAKVGFSVDSVWAAERGNNISDIFASRLARALSTPDERVTVDDITVSGDTGSDAEPKALAS